MYCIVGSVSEKISALAHSPPMAGPLGSKNFWLALEGLRLSLPPADKCCNSKEVAPAAPSPPAATASSHMSRSSSLPYCTTDSSESMPGVSPLRVPVAEDMLEIAFTAAGAESAAKSFWRPLQPLLLGASRHAWSNALSKKREVVALQ